MNAPGKFPMITVMTAREFNQNRSRAMQAAKEGPVSITSRGRPAYVLMTEEEFRQMQAKPQSAWDALTPSIVDALADKNGPDIDIMDYIPPRRVEPIRSPFEDDE